jgi:hypothetical protein
MCKRIVGISLSKDRWNDGGNFELRLRNIEFIGL